MLDPDEIPKLRQTIQEATERDRVLLDGLRAEVRPLRLQAKVIEPRRATSISVMASDGGNNRLEFDPFHIQLVRVVDSYGKQLCLETVTPTTDTEELSRRQFGPDGNPLTALGRMMKDLGVDPPLLDRLSPMIPDGPTVRERPELVAPGWVQVYQDLCEWAALYGRICDGNFPTDTLLIRDGLLRSKIFRGDLFMRLRNLMLEAIERVRREDRRKVYLVGLAKRSKVLDRYWLAMTLERVLPDGSPCYVRVPRSLEEAAYVWNEYARGVEEATGGEAPKFVAGDMYFVRFGRRAGDPIWTLDILSGQSDAVPEIMGYLLADAIDGFPVPFYPRSLQKAHEYAQLRGFDMEILQSEVMEAVGRLLEANDAHIWERLRFHTDPTARRGRT